MIVPSYTEDEVLKELLEDWPQIKRKAKKLGKELMEAKPKWCIGLQKDNAFHLHEKYRSKNGNTWNVGVITRSGQNSYQSKIFCEVETKYRVKSYFFLRGHARNKPYYVELTSHAIRRMRERCKNNDGEYVVAEMSVGLICDYMIFDKGELGVFLKKGKIDENGEFVPELDHEGNFYGKVILHSTLFFARATKQGNYVFKTFIYAPPKEGKRNFELAALHSGLWQLLNCERSSLPFVKEFSKLTKEQRINVVLEKSPNSYDYINKLKDIMLVLEP